MPWTSTLPPDESDTPGGRPGTVCPDGIAFAGGEKRSGPQEQEEGSRHGLGHVNSWLSWMHHMVPRLQGSMLQGSIVK